MQCIRTLQERGGLPLRIGPSAASEAPLPQAVADHIRQGRLWHLVAWSDDDTGTIGLWHKRSSIALQCNELEGIAVEFMRRAKGSGWVALEAKVRHQPFTIPLLQTTSFDPDALAWLLQNKIQMTQVFGRDISVHDRGLDY